MTQPKKILLVDCYALCYAALYSNVSLLKGPVSETGVIYGFFNMLQKIVTGTGAVHIVFLWDSRKNRRKLLFSDYKNKKARNVQYKKENVIDISAAFKDFFMLRRVILPRLGFVNNFFKVGFEADDLIAKICMHSEPKENQHFYIASSDQDLYQLLADNVSMHIPLKNTLFTKGMFIKKYGITPKSWGLAKAVMGCKSDCVPGIARVGEKTACKWILAGCPDNHALISTPEAKKIIERNKPLVILPFKDTPSISLSWDTLPFYSEWLAFCEEYSFNSFLERCAIWESLFTGTPVLMTPTHNNMKGRIYGKRKG